MNLLLLFLIYSSAVSVSALEIPRLSIRQWRSSQYSGIDLHHLLSNYGVLRFAMGESVTETRREALINMCECQIFLDETALTSYPRDIGAKNLADGTHRITLATASIGLSKTLPLPLWIEQECGKDTYKSLTDLRGIVSDVVNLFVAKLGQKNGNKINEDLRDALSKTSHPEHFHVYNTPSSGRAGADTLEFHTDAGFFLAFVPALNCNSYQTDNESFFLEGHDEPLSFEEDEVIIMMGAGAQYSLSSDLKSGVLNEESPFVAASHALRLKPGSHRSWYGKMHLLPVSFDETAQLPQAERMLQQDDHTIPSDCNNSTNFFCWNKCLKFPETNVSVSSLYCLDPARVTADGNITSAYDACAGGFIHNPECEGAWYPTDSDIPGYDLVTDDGSGVSDDNSSAEEPAPVPVPEEPYPPSSAHFSANLSAVAMVAAGTLALIL